MSATTFRTLSPSSHSTLRESPTHLQMTTAFS